MTNKIDKTVLLLGAERSGTNLVRSILHSHSNVYFPTTVRLIEEFVDNEQYYKTKESFVEDVLKLVELNHDPWEWVPDFKSVIERTNAIDIYEVKRIIYEECCRYFNTEVIGLKWIGYANYFAEIKKCFPEIKIIHLVRDPRDVALSWKNVNMGPKHVYFAAKRWTEKNKSVEKCFKKNNLADQIFRLRYEDLLQNFEVKIKRLVDFLGIEFQNQMLQYHKNTSVKKSSRSHRVWENISKPVMKNNYKKYRGKLKDKEIRIIESIAKELMGKYGYDLEFTPEKLSNNFNNYQITWFGFINRLKRQLNYRYNQLKGTTNKLKKRKDRFRKKLQEKFSE